MTDDGRLLVEQDGTIARVAETSLRMMAGTVGSGTLRAIQDELRAHPEAFPWQQVCNLVVAEPVDPSDLVNRGIVAQRDWVHRAQRPAVAAAPGTPARPARSRSASNLAKRLLAMLIVRGTFYVVFAAAFLVMLVLVERKWGFDVYAAGRAVEEFARGLLG